MSTGNWTLSASGPRAPSRRTVSTASRRRIWENSIESVVVAGSRAWASGSSKRGRTVHCPFRVRGEQCVELLLGSDEDIDQWQHRPQRQAKRPRWGQSVGLTSRSMNVTRPEERAASGTDCASSAQLPYRTHPPEEDRLGRGNREKCRVVDGEMNVRGSSR